MSTQRRRVTKELRDGRIWASTEVRVALNAVLLESALLTVSTATLYAAAFLVMTRVPWLPLAPWPLYTLLLYLPHAVHLLIGLGAEAVKNVAVLRAMALYVFVALLADLLALTTLVSWIVQHYLRTLPAAVVSANVPVAHLLFVGAVTLVAVVLGVVNLSRFASAIGHVRRLRRLYGLDPDNEDDEEEEQLQQQQHRTPHHRHHRAVAGVGLTRDDQ